MKRLKKIMGLLLLLLACCIVKPEIVPQISNITEVQAASPKLSKKSASIFIGQNLQLKVKYVPKSVKKIKWASSNKNIATVDSKGKVTGKRQGTVTITTKVGSKRLSCKVTVKSILSSTKNAITITDNQKQPVTITYKGNGTITYHIADTDIISCSWAERWSGNNIILYIQGKKSGTTTVSLTNTYNKEKIVIKVTVDLSVKGVNISSSSERVYVGNTIDLNASVYPSYATNQGIIWKSDNESVATVRNGRVSGVSTGQATITAYSAEGNHSASCVVTVISPVNMKLPRTPLSIANYRYNGRTECICKITDVRFKCKKSGSRFYYEIYVDGEKTYSDQIQNVSSTCQIGYKIYKNGAVIDSGTIYTSQVSVGERFVDSYTNGFLDAGDYELRLFDVR